MHTLPTQLPSLLAACLPTISAAGCGSNEYAAPPESIAATS
jgi:hypothetical protein